MREPDAGRPEDVERRDERPSRSSGLTLVGFLGGAVLVAMLLGQLSAPDPTARLPTASTNRVDHPTGPVPYKPIGVESLKRCPVPLGGLALGDHLKVPGWTIERWDCDALTLGPWSFVIRASGGHLAANSAVVIYPVPGQSGELDTPVTTPQGGTWNAVSRSLVWPINRGHHAKIIGDLGQAQLADLATRITIEQGRPHFWSLNGFAATAPTTSGPPVIHEISYPSGDLGLEGKLGEGEVWTTVMTGTGVEAQAFADHAMPAGLVRGKPAIYTSNPYPPRYSFGAGPSSGALAWQSAPDEVTCIGFEGTARTQDAIEVLRAVADEGTALSATQWLNKDLTPAG